MSYPELARRIAINLFSHFSPEEYYRIKDALLVTAFVLEGGEKRIECNWEDREREYKIKPARLSMIDIEGFIGNEVFTLKIRRRHGKWQYAYESQGDDRSHSSKSPDIDLMIDEGFDPDAPPFFPDINQNIILTAQYNEFVIKEQEQDNSSALFIIDLLSSIPLYSKEKSLIKMFAQQYTQEHTHVINASNGQAVVPAYRRWKSNNI